MDIRDAHCGHVLLVGDDCEMVRRLSWHLRCYGYDIEHVSDLSRALARVGHGGFAAVVADTRVLGRKEDREALRSMGRFRPMTIYLGMAARDLGAEDLHGQTTLCVLPAEVPFEPLLRALQEASETNQIPHLSRP